MPFLLKRLYHIANHYEIDYISRQEDPGYSALSLAKLQKIARALDSGASDEVSDAMNDFWKVKF